MNYAIFVFLVLGIIAGGIIAGVYVCLSSSNPHLVEIIIGSIAVSFFIGIASTLIHALLEKKIITNPVISILLVLFSLSVLIAVLVYALNTPKEMSREIPVTYLLHLGKHELPYGFRINDEVASACYLSTTFILRNFREKSPENAKKIREIITSDHASVEVNLFHDLTEYLIAYFLANPFITSEAEKMMYRGETPKWLGFPDEKIRGEYKPIQYIKGDFERNMFYGITAFPDEHILGMRLPKETEINLIRDNETTSRFIIKNKFMTITIGVVYLHGSSGYRVPIFPPSAFVPSETIEEERRGPFKRYDTMIYYDVVFSKLRYGFPEMKYHVEWAENLFSVLQRKFIWGSPKFLRTLYDEKEFWTSFFR